MHCDCFVLLESMLLLEKITVFRILYSNTYHIWALSDNSYGLHYYSILNAILKASFDIYLNHLRSPVLWGDSV